MDIVFGNGLSVAMFIVNSVLIATMRRCSRSVTGSFELRIRESASIHPGDAKDDLVAVHASVAGSEAANAKMQMQN